MSFNDMNRRLSNTASKEDRIRELSETLLRRGLAMTKESARQLALSMVETEQKVQQRFQEKKESATNYARNAAHTTPTTIGNLATSYQDAQANARKREAATEFRERALNPAPVSVQIHYDTPQGELTPNMTVSEAVIDRAPITEPEELQYSNNNTNDAESNNVEPANSRTTNQEPVIQEDNTTDFLIQEDSIQIEEEPTEIDDEEFVDEETPTSDELDQGQLIEEDDAANQEPPQEIIDNAQMYVPQMEVYHDDDINSQDEQNSLDQDTSMPQTLEIEEADESEMNFDAADHAPMEELSLFDANESNQQNSKSQDSEDIVEELEMNFQELSQDGSVENQFPTSQEPNSPQPESADDENISQSTPQESEPTVEPAKQNEPKREDLAKKHGIDLSNIFNVNK